jgi:phospholipase/carboxylesterase
VRSRLSLSLLLIAACHSSAPPSPGSGSAVPAANIEDQWIVQFPHGATDASPLVVAMHGMGDVPFNFSRAWADFPGTAELLFPRGPLTHDDGFAWYEPGDDALSARQVRDADAQLWPAIVKHAHGRPIIVTGFSQGGVMSYALAALHPHDIVHAFPVSGRLPDPLLPTAAAAPITAFHGTADPIIPIEMDRSVSAAFKAAGGPTELREYEGVKHRFVAMEPDIFAAIVEALPE